MTTSSVNLLALTAEPLDQKSALGVTLKEALEFNREEAVRAAAPDYTEESLTV